MQCLKQDCVRIAENGPLKALIGLDETRIRLRLMQKLGQGEFQVLAAGFVNSGRQRDLSSVLCNDSNARIT